MPTLHLLRHAKSSWAGDAGDHERPLAPRGRRAAAEIAAHMRRQGIAPTLVLCSSARRTRETLELIAPALPPAARTLVEDGLYGARAGEILERIRRVPADVDALLVVGHNPGLEDLASELAAGDGRQLRRLREKFPAGALATLAVPGPGWDRLQPGSAELVAFVVPAELG